MGFIIVLACAAFFVVEKVMRNGYVGIVSRKGLCRFQIERTDTLRHIEKATEFGRTAPRIGFWAILPDETAGYIFRLIEQGAGWEALHILNQSAIEAGHFFPLHQ